MPVLGLGLEFVPELALALLRILSARLTLSRFFSGKDEQHRSRLYTSAAPRLALTKSYSFASAFLAHFIYIASLLFLTMHEPSLFTCCSQRSGTTMHASRANSRLGLLFPRLFRRVL